LLVGLKTCFARAWIDQRPTVRDALQGPPIGLSIVMGGVYPWTPGRLRTEAVAAGSLGPPRWGAR